MNKVAIYCRLSDEDRNKVNSFDDSESIQNQKNMLAKYAIEHEWNIYKIYSDDDFSGLDSDRPEWNIMIKDAEDKKFNIILSKSQARFTRDMEAVEKYLHSKFVEWDIRFVGITDNADTAEKGNKKSRQINGLVNEWYCEDISENIKAVFKSKRQDGKFIGSFASYGYMKDPEDKNELIIDDEVAGVVRLIYNLYLEGYGTQRIAFMLNEKGIYNPTKYKQSKGINYVNANATNDYGFWNKTTVKRILKNELYIGNMVQGRRKKVSYKSKKIVSTPKERWVIVENTHEPIIDIETFKEVQNKISKRVRSTGDGKAHVLAKKVKCMDCGSTMNKVTAYKDYTYLRCKTYATIPSKNLCTSHSIKLNILEDTVAKRLKKHINSYLDETNIIYKLQMETDINSKLTNLQNELNNTEKQLNQSSLIFKNLYLDKIKGTITDEQFIDLNTTFTNDKGELIKRKADIEGQINKFSESTCNSDRWVEILKKYKDFDRLTHAMVDKFIDYIEIGEKDRKTKEQRVKIHWMF